jgi:DNA modification methylase
VERVCDGGACGVCFTSPPYAQQRDYTKRIDDWNGLMQGVFANIPANDETQVLVNIGLIHKNGEWVSYWDQWVEWMREHGWRRFGWYVWDQLSGFPGVFGGRCAPSFEFIFHFNQAPTRAAKSVPTKPEGTTRHGGRMGKNGWETDYHIDRINTTGKNKIPDATWRFSRQTLGLGHSAIFPVAVPSLALRTWPGNVFDPFLGSGTTLVACEQLSRVGVGIEISPGYVAVALQRLKDMGLSPKLEGSSS